MAHATPVLQQSGLPDMPGFNPTPRGPVGHNSNKPDMLIRNRRRARSAARKMIRDLRRNVTMTPTAGLDTRDEFLNRLGKNELRHIAEADYGLKTTTRMTKATLVDLIQKASQS